MIDTIRKLTRFFGIDTHKILFDIFEQNAKSVLDEKLEILDPRQKDLLLEEDERYHYGDSELSEIASRHVVRSFTIDRIRFIRDCLGEGGNAVIADLGDSNGIFLRSLGRNGISVNISGEIARTLSKKNLDAIRSDIQYLPFRQNSIDVVLLFETLEHVQNPLLLMDEIGRVCHGSLIVSIPYVTETHINRYNYTDGRPLYQYHIFEFNPADFKKIAKLTQFDVATEKVAVVLDEKKSVSHRIIFYLWSKFIDRDTFCGCFKKFYMCQLVKKRGEGTQ